MLSLLGSQMREETSLPESVSVQKWDSNSPACSPVVELFRKKIAFNAPNVHPDAPAAAPSGSKRARRTWPEGLRLGDGQKVSL